MVWSEPKVAQAIHLCFAPKICVMRGDMPPAYFATQETITTVFPSYWNTMGPNLLKWVFNNRFLRERGMASNPKMEYQVFLCIFQIKNSAMVTLGLKEMEKFLWEGREKAKLNWDSQKGRTFSLPSQRNFPISFIPKVHWENAKKGLILWKVGWTPCLFSS